MQVFRLGKGEAFRSLRSNFGKFLWELLWELFGSSSGSSLGNNYEEEEEATQPRTRLMRQARWRIKGEQIFPDANFEANNGGKKIKSQNGVLLTLSPKGELSHFFGNGGSETPPNPET